MEDIEPPLESTENSKTKIKPYKFNTSIYEEEEIDNFILSIRESIINNVMLEIDRIDLTTRTIAFIVDIGCDALWRMLNIEFIQHNEYSDFETPAWKGDGCTKPSPKDSWTAKSIPIVSTKTKPAKEFPKFIPKICDCQQLGIPCECLLPAAKRDMDQMKLIQEPIEISIPTQENDEDEDQISLGEEEELEPSFHESYPKVSSVVDDMSKSIASLKSEYSSDDEKRIKCVLSEGFSKLQEKKKQVSLPILNVTHPTRAVSLTNMITELPALRVSVKTECETVKEDPKPTKKKVSK